MKIALIVIGKTDAGYFVEAINEYKNRLVHYIPFEMEVIPDIKNVKNLSESQQKEKEGELILKALLLHTQVFGILELGDDFHIERNEVLGTFHIIIDSGDIMFFDSASYY